MVTFLICQFILSLKIEKKKKNWGYPIFGPFKRKTYKKDPMPSFNPESIYSIKLRVFAKFIWGTFCRGHFAKELFVKAFFQKDFL